MMSLLRYGRPVHCSNRTGPRPLALGPATTSSLRGPLRNLKTNRPRASVRNRDTYPTTSHGLPGGQYRPYIASTDRRARQARPMNVKTVSVLPR
jgi:hypothetical protein